MSAAEGEAMVLRHKCRADVSSCTFAARIRRRYDTPSACPKGVTRCICALHSCESCTVAAMGLILSIDMN
eukprot:scaffold29433_cov132-Cyclotella_meneghiniana.AAC.1